jgi:hypothetical protein
MDLATDISPLIFTLNQPVSVLVPSLQLFVQISFLDQLINIHGRLLIDQSSVDKRFGIFGENYRLFGTDPGAGRAVVLAMV